MLICVFFFLVKGRIGGLGYLILKRDVTVKFSTTLNWVPLWFGKLRINFSHSAVLIQLHKYSQEPDQDALLLPAVRAQTAGRSNESHPSEQLEQQIDRWALTVRVTLAEGWSKGEAGKAAGCVCLSVGAVWTHRASPMCAHFAAENIRGRSFALLRWKDNK